MSTRSDYPTKPNFFAKDGEVLAIPHCELLEEHAKLCAVWSALRTLKDNNETLFTERDDAILFGCINLLEDILPRIMHIQRNLEI
jgi:hypothetical protein